MSGETGSAQVIAGRTLGLRMEALDLHIRTAGRELSDGMLEEMTRRCLTAPERLPVDGEPLWRFLRDALAPLVVEAPVVPPGETPGPLIEGAQSLEQAAREGQAAPEVIAACAKLDQKIALALEWPAYARGAAILRGGAIDALWLVTSASASSVPATSLGALGSAFVRAVDGVCSGEVSGSLPGKDDAASIGGRGIRTLALVARCIDLAARAQPELSGRQVLDALVRLVTQKDLRTNLPADLNRDDSVCNRLGRIDRLLRMLAGRETSRSIGPDDVVRQLRPAIKPLEDARRQAAGELLEACARAVTSPDVLTDPGFFQAIHSYQSRRDDLLLTVRVTESLGHKPATPTGQEGSRWVLADRFEFAGDRLLLLARGIASPKDHDVAMEQWRTMGEGAMAIVDDACENALRTAASGGEDPLGDEVRAVTGGRADELLTRLGSAKDEWNQEVRKARQVESAGLAAATAKLKAIRKAVALAVEYSRFRKELASAPPGGVSSDSGCVLASWELSSEAARILSSADLPQVSVGLGLAAEGKLDEFSAGTWARPGMEVRSLVVDVASRARERGLRVLSDGAADALGQLATGWPDPDGQGASLRGDLMAMSRYMEELAGAIVRGDSEAQGALTRYLQTRAEGLRAEVERMR